MTTWQTHVVLSLALIAGVGLLACDSAGGTGGTATNLGVEGASCVRTPDCQPPLQCMGNVCVAIGGGADAGTDAAMDTIADVSDVPPLADPGEPTPDIEEDELPVVHEIATEADLAGWEFQDSSGPGPAPDVPDGMVDPFSDCEVLGIGPHWQGMFLGAIDYDIQSGGLVYPEKGIIFVQGDLSFDIECIDSKLVVKGDMDGTATVEEQGEFPFTTKLAGYYSPKNQHLDAQIVEGAVTIFELIEVYFAGDFVGDIAGDGDFVGTWSGYSTGTNQEFITGEAEGDGNWNADEVE